MDKKKMKIKRKHKSLLEKKMKNPAYRKRHEKYYELFKKEVQEKRALEL